MKRAASSELVGKPSAFHSGVTLFEPGSPTVTTPRRSKRLKLEPDSLEETSVVTVVEEKKLNRRERKTVVKVEEIEATANIVVKQARQSASPRKPKPVPQALAVPHPAPPKWKEQYDTIKCMREKIVAPVDTMGCDQAQRYETDPKVCCRSSVGPLCTYNIFAGQTVLNSGVSHVVLSNERRGHRRCGVQVTRGGWRNVDSRGHIGRG